MKKNKLRDIMVKRLEDRKHEISKIIKDNMGTMYVFENNKFILISEMDNQMRSYIEEDLNNNKITKVYVDKYSKDDIEKHDAKLKTKDCEGAVIINSTITGTLSLQFNNIFILNSRITGEKNRILHNVLIENGSMVTDSSFSFVILNGATSLDSNLNLVFMEKGALVNSYSFLANGVYIKEDVMIGPNCNLIVNTYEYHRPFEYYSANEEAEENALVINEQAWIGADVNIIKAVNIGVWSLLAAGTVISEDVDDFTLAIGTKRKSILERLEKIKDNEEYLMRMLKRDYPSYAGGELIFNILMRKLKDRKDANRVLRLFFIYANSDFIKYNKKVDIHGNIYIFDFKERYFEFASPDKVELDIKNKNIKISYNKTYNKVKKIREDVLKLLCNFGEIKEEIDKSYTILIDDKTVGEIIELDKIFNKEIVDVIESMGIDINTCNIELERL